MGANEWEKPLIKVKEEAAEVSKFFKSAEGKTARNLLKLSQKTITLAKWEQTLSSGKKRTGETYLKSYGFTHSEQDEGEDFKRKSRISTLDAVENAIKFGSFKPGQILPFIHQQLDLIAAEMMSINLGE